MCDTLNGAGEDGSSFMRVDLSIDCNGGAYRIMRVYAVAMVLLWPVGVPCIYGAMIYRSRAMLSRLQAIELAAGAQAQLATTTKPGAAPTDGAAPVVEMRTSVAGFRSVPGSEAARLYDEVDALRKKLPTILKKLTASYKMDCFWCARALAGRPAAPALLLLSAPLDRSARPHPPQV